MSDQRFFNHRDTQLKADQPRVAASSDASRRQAHRGHSQRGSDPYNTSGSFDRKKNWTRVGKR